MHGKLNSPFGGAQVPFHRGIMADPLSAEMRNFIEDFGEAYVRFGHPKLMGRIVGLLLCQESAISLDQMVELLEVSKGPVSQIAQRLLERNLIERRWIPGDRKDYYEAHTHIFPNAFKNLLGQFELNLQLAQRHREFLKSQRRGKFPLFKKRLDDMYAFYEGMLKATRAFLKAWEGNHLKSP
jgi:DNA-binding MarR family transcriptional regulator